MNTSTIFFGLMNRHNDLFIKIPREHLNNFSAACRTGIIGIAERDRGQGAVVSVRKKAGHRHFFTIDSNIFWNFRKLQNFEENIKNVFPNYLNKCDDTFFVARQTSAGWSLAPPQGQNQTPPTMCQGDTARWAKMLNLPWIKHDRQHNQRPIRYFNL